MWRPIVSGEGYIAYPPNTPKAKFQFCTFPFFFIFTSSQLISCNIIQYKINLNQYNIIKLDKKSLAIMKKKFIYK